jgi:E3 SUMO-protein ligase PIAS1
MFHRWRGHAQSASGLMASQGANSYPGAPVNRPFIGTTAGPSNAPRYDPFPSSRNPTLPLTTPVPHTSTPAALPRPGRSTFNTLGCCEVTNSPYCIAIRFKPSPFFHIDQPVSSIAECPGISSFLTNLAPPNTLPAESSSSGDRRQQVLLFTLNADQIAKLKSSEYVPVTLA